MAFRYSTQLRDAGLDARVKAVGPSPVLKIYSEGQKGGEVSGELVSINLPLAWMKKASDGIIESDEPWHGIATGKGMAKSFRIYDKAEKTCHIEGAIPDDMALDNRNIAPDQLVTVTVFVIKSGNG